MFDQFKHQQGVYTKPRLQRYFPLHITDDAHNSKAEHQQSSIREDIYQKYSPSTKDSSSTYNSLPSSYSKE